MKILIAYNGSEFAKAILDDLRYAGLPPRAEVAGVASLAGCSVEVVRGPARRCAEISEFAACARHKDSLHVAN